MFKLILRLVVVAAIAHAGVKIVPVFWTYANFKDRLTETARFGGKKSPEQLADKSTKIANELGVELDSPITVERTPQATVIDARYTGQLEYLPRRYYPWNFVIHLEEKPTAFDAYMP